MRKDIEFIHDEKNHSYLVNENNFQYTMPYVYMVILKKHLVFSNDNNIDKPIESWYHSLRDVEKRIVEKQNLLAEKMQTKSKKMFWF